MKYCTKCGAQLADDAKFCTKCGAKVAASSAPKAAAVKAASESDREARKRKIVELPKKDVDAFNSAVSKVKGRAETVKKAVEPKASKKDSSPKTSVFSSGSAAEKAKPAAAVARAVASGAPDRFVASASAGELAFGEFDLSGRAFSGITEGFTEALSPVKAIIKTFGSFVSGLFTYFKKPKYIILLVIIVAVWTVLGILRGNSNPVVKILSWLTFADGGLDRDSIAGMIGGAFGKGTVAAALGSLFTGGIPNFFKGIGSAIKGTGEKRSIVSLVIGLVIGAALYFAFAGLALASKATAMAGIAGAVLSLEAIGRKAGPLYSLAQSLTSKKENGVRFAQSGKAQSLLSGLFLGFALATALMALIG